MPNGTRSQLVAGAGPYGLDATIIGASSEPHDRLARMDHIDIDAQALDEMRKADPTEPVVMLNLLKFRDEALPGFGVDAMTGQEAFRRYGELNNAEDVRYENDPIWVGTALRSVIGSEEWDMAALVHYPTRQHFLDKMDDPKYQEIAKVRVAALLDSRLVELTQLLPPQ